MFSSKRSSFRVPGMGTINGCWASSRPSAIWAGVAFFRSAMLLSRSTKAWFAFLASGVKLGIVFQMSVLANSAFSSRCPLGSKSKHIVGASQRNEPCCPLS